MSYLNLSACGSKHSNPAKGLPSIHSTVIFQVTVLVRRDGYEPPNHVSAYISGCSTHFVEVSERVILVFASRQDLTVGASDGNRTHIPSLEGWYINHYVTPACCSPQLYLALNDWRALTKTPQPVGYVDVSCLSDIQTLPTTILVALSTSNQLIPKGWRSSIMW